MALNVNRTDRESVESCDNLPRTNRGFVRIGGAEWSLRVIRLFTYFISEWSLAADSLSLFLLSCGEKAALHYRRGTFSPRPLFSPSVPVIHPFVRPFVHPSAHFNINYRARGGGGGGGELCLGK